ncbi:hypothetical protein [Actinomadura coerulea]|uniref:hypothetical protein n=1 Tax=Actinomadura coerulea TaxID=46159 RepID=UPI0034131EBF
MAQTNEPDGPAQEPTEEPTWQPVAAVGAMTGVVAEQLTDTHKMLALLEQARPGPPGRAGRRPPPERGGA